MTRTARVIVPASSANLGPGYDAFGLALGLYNEFEARPAEAWSVEVAGEGAGELTPDESNAVVRAMRAVFEEAGYRGCAQVRCRNTIPIGRGLGSSSAAIVGGVLLANALLGEPFDRERLFEVAARIEGHPDNVAPALLGGFTVAWYEEERPFAVRFEPQGGLAVVAAIAPQPLPTREARAALPSTVPHPDAVRTVARAALMALGIVHGSQALIAAGAADRLHEPYRRVLISDMEQVRSALVDAGVDGAVLSGAGPTLIGLVTARDEDRAFERAASIAASLAQTGAAGEREVRALRIDRDGARWYRGE